MAQTTSSLWKTLWRTRGTKKEYQFDINGVIYGPAHEVEHSVDTGLYEEFGIGNAATAKLTLTLYADNIPRAATIKRFIRLRNGCQSGCQRASSLRTGAVRRTGSGPLKPLTLCGNPSGCGRRTSPWFSP